ncbi:hypothetical protein C6H88_02505 [Chlamydia muridarum str. Nigg]|uniref:Uncharacterized protein n=1 Tax=Chlamydia muridarum TaxID=83560 RepID=A0A069ZZ46_CHLMR|nr:hypothetical protein TAC_02565 [Chlamydia muridarum str. Nigg3 CMUT3-5]AHH23799.1 hypothetical protein Y015_02565 [Chlamydia muridarum str. Nigg CM972]AID38008.1 hypothetical protein BB17_02610 [Chlamydia muridarum str. Nigg 2 MCR]AIT90670.1 hypothetical protein NC80_02430 [Chlamydia muridarum]AVM88236.1 hypothetical protein C6H96_02505 [Chlamydia muridarum str. Nigg]UFW99742.1 hypothetical protein FTM85_02610 [Chlamydia trachomatis]
MHKKSFLFYTPYIGDNEDILIQLIFRTVGNYWRDVFSLCKITKILTKISYKVVCKRFFPTK